MASVRSVSYAHICTTLLHGSHLHEAVHQRDNAATRVQEGNELHP